MRNTISRIILIGGAVAVGLLSGLACWTEADPAFARDPGTDQAATVADGLGAQVGHDHPVDVHWQTVDSFDELVRSSDLIVRGKVETRRAANLRLYGWNAEAQRPNTPEEAGDSYRDLPLVVSTVRVDRVIRAGAKIGRAHV